MSASPPETRISLLHRLKHPEDVAAWDEFVGIYGPVIFRAAKKRGFQSADADNLVQEVLIAVSQSIENWLKREDRGSFRAWLLRIARNESIDMLTRRATRPLGADGEATLQMLEGIERTCEVSELIDREYKLAVFQAAAKKVQQSVAQHTWQAFWLTHVDGLSIEEAADELETRLGNIHFGRSRVMSKIRDFVNRYEESNE